MFQEIQEGCGGKILVLRSTAVRIRVCGYSKKKEDIPKIKMVYCTCVCRCIFMCLWSMKYMEMRRNMQEEIIKDLMST